MASIEVTGTGQVMNEIEKKFGNKQMNKLSTRALRKAAEMFLTELKKELSSVNGPYRTGATVEEAELHGPVKGRRGTMYVIRWRGPKDRYRLIHINEWGTVKNPNPPLKGAIARMMKNVEKRYYKRIEKELKKGVA